MRVFLVFVAVVCLFVALVTWPFAALHDFAWSKVDPTGEF